MQKRSGCNSLASNFFNGLPVLKTMRVSTEEPVQHLMWPKHVNDSLDVPFDSCNFSVPALVARLYIAKSSTDGGYRVHRRIKVTRFSIVHDRQIYVNEQ